VATTKTRRFEITQPPYEVVEADETTTYDQLARQAQATERPVLVRRDGQPDMALLPAADLDAIFTELHLLSSPENARRLLEAIERARARVTSPRTLEDVCRQVGLEPPA
jgi:antitoxin YefM